LIESTSLRGHRRDAIRCFRNPSTSFCLPARTVPAPAFQTAPVTRYSGRAEPASESRRAPFALPRQYRDAAFADEALRQAGR